MTKKGLGQYDIEYAQCQCYWGKRPGKFVTFLLDELKKGPILDLGAGEGKNAIAVAQKGFEVIAVECSEYAISNFECRLQTLDPHVRSRIKIIQTDVRFFETKDRFQAVIAYGLLHCLSSESDIYKMVDFMKSSTILGGYNVLVTFVRGLPVPEVQNYLTATLLPVDDFKEMYGDWQIKRLEEDILTEKHPTSKTIHQHSICRIFARRPKNV